MIGEGRRGARERHQVRIYDFRRPDKFSKEQVRTLFMLHDHLARLLGQHLTGLLRLPAQLTVERVEQQSYDEFIRSTGAAAVIAIMGMAPLPGGMVISINQQIAFAMVDRLFGGPGQPLLQSRPLTAVERGAVGKVLQGTAGVLREAWAGFLSLKPELEAIEDNPLFNQAVAGNEVGAVVRCQLRLGETRGDIAFFLPHLMIEPLAHRLTSQVWMGRITAGQGRRRRALIQRLQSAPLRVQVILGRAELSIDQFLALQAGDVLRLDSRLETLLPLEVEGRVKFWGKAGRVGQRLAYQVHSVAARGDGGNG